MKLILRGNGVDKAHQGAITPRSSQAMCCLDELQGSELTTKLREQRLERENNLLENQRFWLDKEFQRTSDDLAELQREHAQQGLDLRGKLDSLTQEKENMKETMKTLKEQHEEQCKRLEDALQKLKEQRDVQAGTEEQFRKELAAQAKLISLYKSAADDAEQKSTELMRGVEELHPVLREAGKEQRAVLLEQRLLESQKKLDAGRNECTELEKKLQDAERKCQEMESKCRAQEEVEKFASSMKGKLEQTVVELEKEKQDLITALEKRERDAEQLNGEWKLLSEKLSASLLAWEQLQGQLDELQDSELTTKLHEQRLERENNLLENQRSWLDKELQHTSDDLAKLRREHAQQGLDLQGKLDSLTQEDGSKGQFEDLGSCFVVSFNERSHDDVLFLFSFSSGALFPASSAANQIELPSQISVAFPFPELLECL
uniref:nucleoprotein TPR-like n=1 Tax=Myxine glutinosa TaxID=7769 RepID=UPI00358F6341